MLSRNCVVPKCVRGVAGSGAARSPPFLPRLDGDAGPRRHRQPGAGSSGIPSGAAILSTVLIWAGPAQAIFYGGIAAGMAPVAIAVAVCFSSIRFFPMTIAILPLLRGGGGDGARRPAWAADRSAAHYIGRDGVDARTCAGCPTCRRSGPDGVLLGFGNACLLLASLATGAGYFLLGALPLPLAAGMLVPHADLLHRLGFRRRARFERVAGHRARVCAGAAVARRFVGDSFDLLTVGLVARHHRLRRPAGCGRRRRPQ